MGVLRGIGSAIMGMIRSLPALTAGLARGIGTIASTYWGYILKGAGAAWASMKWTLGGAWGWIKGMAAGGFTWFKNTAVGGWIAGKVGAFFTGTAFGKWIAASYAAVGFKNLMLGNFTLSFILTIFSDDPNLATFGQNLLFGFTAPLFGGAWTAFRATGSLFKKSGIWIGTSLFSGGLYSLSNGEFNIETFLSATLVSALFFPVVGMILGKSNNPFFGAGVSAIEEFTKKQLVNRFKISNISSGLKTSIR
ncbi:hypothetical protein JCM19037_4660 [Geomicrobium sp. JCM 19037]|nr:hypothetical protein JCM19037_4660 [Geomicrobium sp. JCM 19037]